MKKKLLTSLTIIALLALHIIPDAAAQQSKGQRAIAKAESLPAPILKFIDQHCVDCHNDTAMEGGLDLGTLAKKPITPESLPTWIKAHDNVQSGEMPPDASSSIYSSKLSFLRV